jgi:hypothetical protein
VNTQVKTPSRWYPIIDIVRDFTANDEKPVPAGPGEDFNQWHARQPLPIDSEGGHAD